MKTRAKQFKDDFIKVARDNDFTYEDFTVYTILGVPKQKGTFLLNHSFSITEYWTDKSMDKLVKDMKELLDPKYPVSLVEGSLEFNDGLLGSYIITIQDQPLRDELWERWQKIIKESKEKSLKRKVEANQEDMALTPADEVKI